MNWWIMAGFGITHQILFQKSTRIRFITRMFMFALAIVASCVNGIVGALILYPLGKGIWVNQMIAYTMKLLVPLLTGMHFDIVSGDEHLESTKPRIYLCNHQATLDMFLFGACLPKRCVITAKREVKFIPFMGQAFVMGKNILLNRQNRESAIEALNKVGEQMIKDNLSLWVFPEGTRTHQIDNSIRPLKKGAFHLAKQYGFELVPIVASTFYPVYNEKRMIFERGTIQIKVLDPIPTNTNETVDEIIAKTHALMSSAIKDIKTIPDTNRKLKYQ